VRSSANYNNVGLKFAIIKRAVSKLIMR